jgi:hypothetical protein
VKLKLLINWLWDEKITGVGPVSSQGTFKWSERQNSRVCRGHADGRMLEDNFVELEDGGGAWPK